MKSGEAAQILAALGVLLFLMRPITGLFLDLLKIMLMLSATGVALMILPLDFLDQWSKSAAGWTHFTAVYIPVMALFGLIALSTVNIAFLTGTVVEQVVKGILYIVGGIFSVGSPQWIAWDKSVGDLVIGAIGIAFNALKIFGTVLGIHLN